MLMVMENISVDDPITDQTFMGLEVVEFTYTLIHAVVNTRGRYSVECMAVVALHNPIFLRPFTSITDINAYLRDDSIKRMLDVNHLPSPCPKIISTVESKRTSQ